MQPHALRTVPGCALRAAPHRAVAPRLSRCAAAPPRPARSAARMAPARAAITDVFALDFDGVVCDSVGESALSAWTVRRAQPLPPRLAAASHRQGAAYLLPRAQASEQLWPDVFCAPGAAAQKQRVLDEMRLVRPVVETGYENLIQARLLLEARPGTRPDDMLANWGCAPQQQRGFVCNNTANVTCAPLPGTARCCRRPWRAGGCSAARWWSCSAARATGG